MLHLFSPYWATNLTLFIFLSRPLQHAFSSKHPSYCIPGFGACWIFTLFILKCFPISLVTSLTPWLYNFHILLISFCYRAQHSFHCDQRRMYDFSPFKYIENFSMAQCRPHPAERPTYTGEVRVSCFCESIQ